MKEAYSDKKENSSRIRTYDHLISISFFINKGRVLTGSIVTIVKSNHELFCKGYLKGNVRGYPHWRPSNKNIYSTEWMDSWTLFCYNNEIQNNHHSYGQFMPA